MTTKTTYKVAVMEDEEATTKTSNKVGTMEGAEVSAKAPKTVIAEEDYKRTTHLMSFTQANNGCQG